MDCGSWWFHHVMETYRYVLGARDRARILKADASHRLLTGASEWGILLGLPAASRLMADHVKGVARLVDASALGDAEGAARAVESVIANASEHQGLYGAAIQGFPLAEFRDLIEEHIAETGSYVVALFERDYVAFRNHMNAVIANAQRMAALWRRICAPAGRRGMARGLPASVPR